MGAGAIVKGTKQDASSLEGHSGKLVAERWGLTYREAHTLSIDPAALEIVDREESRRLRVLPLEFGPDGPVFAVAEPSEERFAAVRDLAGDNASFVVVARETLDALLNSKVFSVPTSARRPALFRSRNDFGTADLEIFRVEAETIEAANGNGDAAAVEGDAVEAGVTDTEPPEGEAVEETTASAEEHSYGESHAGHDSPEDSESPEQHGSPEQESHEQGSSEHHEHASAEATGSTTALDNLLTQIATGAGSLRAQVDQLTESLEATQRELREANEQLAEANRVAEGHEETVTALRDEIETLRAELTGSTSMNASMTARLEEVARSLMEIPTAEARE